MKRRTAGLTALMALVLLAAGSQVSADRVKFRQNILPIDCLLQNISNGTGTDLQLTPDECGDIINPPPEEPSPEHSPLEEPPPENKTSHHHETTPRPVFSYELPAIPDYSFDTSQPPDDLTPPPSNSQSPEPPTGNFATTTKPKKTGSGAAKYILMGLGGFAAALTVGLIFFHAQWLSFLRRFLSKP